MRLAWRFGFSWMKKHQLLLFFCSNRTLDSVSIGQLRLAILFSRFLMFYVLLFRLWWETYLLLVYLLWLSEWTPIEDVFICMKSSYCILNTTVPFTVIDLIEIKSNKLLAAAFIHTENFKYHFCLFLYLLRCLPRTTIYLKKRKN